VTASDDLVKRAVMPFSYPTMDYINYNSVKHGMSRSVVDWPYSTFHRYVKNGVYPSNWSGNGIEFVDIGE
jgi:putative transposase